MQFIIKTVVSALIIAAVSTLSKKSPTIGAILISLPIASILSICWLYSDTKDVAKIIDFSRSVTYIIIPSIIFFVALIVLLKKDVSFVMSMFVSSGIMIASYYVYVKVLQWFGVQI